MFYLYNNTIVSLNNVLSIELCESESQHTSCGKKYTIHHYTIYFRYMNDQSYNLYLKDDDNSGAQKVLKEIFEKLNEKA